MLPTHFYNFNKKQFRHFLCSKNIERFEQKKMPKNAVFFSCEKCDFSCSKKSNWEKHVMTRKHQIRTFSNEKMPKNAAAYMCSNCDKAYSSRSSLWYHKKRCIIQIHDISGIVLEDVPTDLLPYASNEIIDAQDVNNLDVKEMFMEVLQENKELRKTIQTMIPKMGNTTNHITNKINMNIFLNQECKDALNIMDFVESLQIQMEDLTHTGRAGFVDGITNIFIRGLRELELHKRPIHCSDLKREVMYVKDNDIWEKETENKDKLKKAIHSVKRSNIQQINSWVEENPECLATDNTKNEDYMQIVHHSLGGSGNQQDKNIHKIIKNVAKEVYLQKDGDID